MEQMNLAATRPLEMQKVMNWIYDAGLQNTEHGKEICEDIVEGGILSADQLSAEAIHWLVDVKNGPSIAPNFGGLRLNTKCHFFKEDNAAVLGAKSPQPITETDTIYVAFSGAKAWQDLQFATCALKRIVKHLNDIPDESFEPGFEPLEEIPEVHIPVLERNLTKTAWRSLAARSRRSRSRAPYTKMLRLSSWTSRLPRSTRSPSARCTPVLTGWSGTRHRSISPTALPRAASVRISLYLTRGRWFSAAGPRSWSGRKVCTGNCGMHRHSTTSR